MTAPQKAEKTFDCVEFKRRAQERIYEQIKGMTPADETEYFRRAAESGPFADFLRRVKAARLEKDTKALSPNR